MADERAHAAAFTALLSAALGAPAEDPNRGAYDLDDVPDVLPAIYAEITVSRRAGAPLWMCGGRPTFGWRITTRVIGTSVDEARWARGKVASVLLDRPVTIDGVESTPVRFETEDSIGPDDGRYSGLTTWTYGR